MKHLFPFYLLTVVGLLAQDPVPPVVTIPPVADDTIQLAFPNNGIADVLGVYELLTGKSVVKESSVFDGRPISLVTARPINTMEAIELIESTLQINGYVLTQAPDGRRVRVTLGTASQVNIPRGLVVHESADTLPNGHSMASYYLKFHKLYPSEAMSMLCSHIGLNSFGRLTPVASP